MPLPTLNTGGVDISNTIAKIEAMKNSRLQRENMLNEMAYRNAQLPYLNDARESLAEERKSRNAMAEIQRRKAESELPTPEVIEAKNAMEVYKSKAEKQKLKKAITEDTMAALSWAKSNPDKENAYDIIKTEADSNGIYMPDKSVFVDDSGNFNSDAFNEFADNGIRAIKLETNPKIGERVQFTMANENYDQSKAESETNPKLVKRVFVVDSNGKLVEKKDIAPEPLPSKIEKQKAYISTAKTRAETAASKKTTGGATGGKIKSIVTNDNGDVIRVMNDGSYQKMDEDDAWVPATKEDLKGIKYLKRESSKEESVFQQRLKGAGGGKTSNEVRPKAPSKDEFLKAMRGKGSKLSDSDLTQYWNDNYK